MLAVAAIFIPKNSLVVEEYPIIRSRDIWRVPHARNGDFVE